MHESWYMYLFKSPLLCELHILFSCVGTHGSAISKGNLAALLVEMKIMTSSGEVQYMHVDVTSWQC